MTSWHNRTLALLAIATLALPVQALEWKTVRQSVATTPFQTKQAAVFSFRNAGNSPVTISDVQTSCDCLEAAADKKTYQPGESGEIRAMFTVGDRIGLYERTVTVVTDEPGGPARLSLQIEVPAVATAQPRSVTWQANEAAGEKFLEVTAAPGLEIIFHEAVPTNDAFTARLEAVEAGRHYRLHLKPRDTAKPASAAIRLFGREKAGHDVVVSAYASVE